jgi:hypothetical protein
MAKKKRRNVTGAESILWMSGLMRTIEIMLGRRRYGEDYSRTREQQIVGVSVSCAVVE